MVDYKGQQLCENLYYGIIVVVSVVSWLVGFFMKDFSIAVQGCGVGLVIALLVTIPDWPFYNRNPVTWLTKVGQHRTSKSSGGKSKGKKEK